MPQQGTKFEPTLDDLVKQLETNNLQFQQRTQTTIQNLNTQIGQLTSSLSQLSKQQMQISDSVEHEIIDVKKPVDDLRAEFVGFTDFDVLFVVMVIYCVMHVLRLLPF